jgi:hypothetical protein
MKTWITMIAITLTAFTARAGDNVPYIAMPAGFGYAIDAKGIRQSNAMRVSALGFQSRHVETSRSPNHGKKTLGGSERTHGLVLIVPVWSFLAILAAAAASNAIDLDAPAQKPVTVRSEIERGIGAVLGAEPSDNLVALIAKANQQKNTDTDAFLFGLYYIGWQDAWSAASIGCKYRSAEEMYERHANEYFMTASELRKRLNLSSTEVRELVGVYYVEDQDALFPQIVASKKFKWDVSVHEVP